MNIRERWPFLAAVVLLLVIWWWPFAHLATGWKVLLTLLVLGILGALQDEGFLAAITGQRTQRTRTETQTKKDYSRVTECKHWKCPHCATALEKPSLGTFLAQPGEDTSKLFGTATCPHCGSQYRQSEVYGGRYDISAAPPRRSASTQACSGCRKGISPSSEYDLSTLTGKIAATQGGLGFRCSSCGKLYCFSCLEAAPQHPGTGGRACPNCGGAMTMW